MSLAEHPGVWDRVQAALPALAQAGAAQQAPLDWGRLQGLVQRWPDTPASVQQHLAPRLAQALARVQANVQAHDPSDAATGLTAPRPARPAPVHWPKADAAPPPGLRSAPALRQSLARLRLAAQVQQAMQAAPASAGPLHAQVLVQRSLGWMQSLSPGYLQHFMQHLDALQALEDGQRRPSAPKAKAAPARATKA